jgi:peptidoglycan hydrolase CwlO-like protein
MRTSMLETDSGRSRRARALIAAPLLAALCALAALGGTAPAQSLTELQSKTAELENVKAQQGDLRAEVDQQNSEINALIAQEAEVRAQEAEVAEELAAKQAELDEATAELAAAEAHLRVVKAQLVDAKAELRKLLVEIYKTEPPDVIDVILESASWDEALAQAEYVGSIKDHQDAVISRVTTLREEIELTVQRLTAARETIEAARDEIAAHRDELASARAELEERHAALVAAKQERQESLAALEEKEDKLDEQISQATPPSPAPASGGTPAPSGETATLVADGTAIAPASAPPAVRATIDAANQIVGSPYVWGGGHGSFESDGYDCSGTVSYALHGGGFLSSPLDSSALAAWGSPGPGNWITVYAQSGHAYAVIAGLRLDTSGTEGGSGPSWSTAMRSSAGFSARHPSGY